jgi:sigma-E factor negative regulatory protein RseA
VKEQISALMDDDLDLENAEHVFKSIKSGGLSAESWSTYHLIGDVMRGNPQLSHDFTSKVMSEIASEPVLLHPKVTSLKVKTPAVWSVAASVAAMMVVGFMALQNQAQDVGLAPVEMAKNQPDEYLLAHQSMAPVNTAYLIQTASFDQGRE